MADAPSFCHTASPQVWSSSRSKLSKHYYGWKYDLRYITQSSTGNENGLKCKLGPKCGENIQNLADAPSFYDTASPQVRSGWDGKHSKHYCGFKYDLRYITHYSTGKENGLKRKLGPECVKNIQNLADAPSICHTASHQVWSSSGSKLSKDYYRCRCDLRYITQSSTGNENGLKCKLGPKCVENFQNLADAPNFCHTTSP